MVQGTYTIEEIKDLLRPLFDGVPIDKAILFGSYARNEATAASDIDIYIDSNGRLNGLDFYGFCEELEAKIQKPVDAVEKIDLDTSSPLCQSIYNEGIVIYDR